MREPIDTASATVAANINKARRCAYSLMGAGMYGMNGIHLEVSIHLWNVYAIPRLTYGLEIYQLNQTNLKQLELCQKQILRNILHLPASAATATLYLISGVAPVLARIERSSLMLFRNLIAYKNTRKAI